MKKTIVFNDPQRLVTTRDASEFLYPYSIVDSSLIGAPEERSRTSRFTLKVGASGTLESCWGLSEPDLVKVLFEYGKRHIVQKLKDGALTDSEELLLHTANAEVPSPFDVSRIESPAGTRIEIDIDSPQIMQDFTLLQLAALIIDVRDNINAIFHTIHKEKLILLREERDLLQFFRDASSHEEFFYRLCALANAATGFNLAILRKITGISDTQVRSIGLLEKYLENLGGPLPEAVKTLRSINRMRQGYPVHGDQVAGVLEAHKHFGLYYPVSDFSAVWRTLLLRYLDALQSILEKIKEKLWS